MILIRHLLSRTLRSTINVSSQTPIQIAPLVFRYFSLTKPRSFDDSDLNDEELYWDNLKAELDKVQSPDMTRSQKSKFSSHRPGKNLFVLQLRMQYRSKARQSTSAELQLAESISLVNSLDGWNVCDSMIVSTKRSGSAGIFGSGNQEMLAKRISSSGCDALFVVIDRLTNLQVETLRRTWVGGNTNVKIYDRYMIVLEIFKRNASSQIAKLQIALAEIPYIRHKFENSDMYKYVEKKIKRELDTKLRTRNVLNTQRRDKHIPTISVFGYTNVGKTSLIKALTNDSKMHPQNKLFATLDVTYHGTSLSQSNQNCVFIDTIGFISDIPTNLVEAFRTSLRDALYADIIIHLVDLSHPDREAQENTVIDILSDLAPEEKLANIITIYNKCDKVKNLEEIKKCNKPNAYYISCKDGQGLSEMKSLMERTIYKQLKYIDLKLNIRQGSEEMAYLYKHAVICGIDESVNKQFIVMSVLMNKVNAIKFVNMFPSVEISR